MDAERERETERDRERETQREGERERNACNVEVITETEIRIHHINTTNVEMMSFYNIFFTKCGSEQNVKLNILPKEKQINV